MIIVAVQFFSHSHTESTAHTLAHALYLLSLHPDIQEEVTGHIMEVLGPDKVPEYENSEQLDKVLAVFYEAVRMFRTFSVQRLADKDILTLL